MYNYLFDWICGGPMIVKFHYLQSWALNTFFLYLNTKYMLKMYLNTKYFLQMYLNTNVVNFHVGWEEFDTLSGY